MHGWRKKKSTLSSAHKLGFIFFSTRKKIKKQKKILFFCLRATKKLRKLIFFSSSSCSLINSIFTITQKRRRGIENWNIQKKTKFTMENYYKMGQEGGRGEGGKGEDMIGREFFFWRKRSKIKIIYICKRMYYIKK